MPPVASKGKSKGREAQRSRSRNTTPNSVISNSAMPATLALTAYLGMETARLMVSSGPQYTEMMEKFEVKPGMAEPKHLDVLIEQLHQLSTAAKARSQTCYLAMTALSDKRKEIAEQEREKERLEREAESRRARMREQAEDDRKVGKIKKRKDRPSAREERPMALGAHGVTRQDGMNVKQEDETKKPRAIRARPSPKPADHPSPSKRAKFSPGSSSLSEMGQSPDAATGASERTFVKKVSSADTSDDERQLPPAPSVTQHAFFPEPLAPDPVIYHIREVTPGTTDEEKKEIYSVTAFPTKDLSDQIAGSPPDKDFSNAKPTNQVAANTFLSYVEPYVRPLTEEDIAFLRERGDRTTPFVIPSRGERHYSEIWAAEDSTTVATPSDRSSANKATGSIEDINDDTIGTDKISGGPLAHRLLSLLRFEHRNPMAENCTINGSSTINGTIGAGPGDANLFGNDSSIDLDTLTDSHLDPNEPKALPPATSVADQFAPKLNLATNGNGAATATGHAAADDRIKLELRHLGFLGVDEEPDFDGHHDDDISVRLRLLQSELQKVMITNGARKARLLDIARERLAYQEYSTIHEDLDSQVQQAYLKRTRTLGKSKRGHHHQGAGGGGGGAGGRPRPNAAGGSLGAGGALAPGLARHRDIGDSARMLMDRRKRWEDCIGPVFEGMRQGVPRSVEAGGESFWDERVMERYEKAEREGLEEETDG